MEREIVRRRMNTISGHFVAGIISDDVAAATTQLFSLNCSSNISSPFKRLDSRLYFGRQASAAQGYFMRQAKSQDEQCGTCSGSNISEDKCVAPTPPLFSRPATGQPLFARPSLVEFDCSNAGIVEAPRFGRPVGATCEGKQSNVCDHRVFSSEIKGAQWLPKINVIESKSSHVITVELPGVEISDVRVEMDDKNIIVKGTRSMKLSKAAGFSNDSFATYHRMEISQGPYQVVWPIPAGADTDSVAAEFVNGMLQITVLKC